MPRTTYSSKATSPLLKLDWSTPSKSCENKKDMTNELLLSNIHLIRMAVDFWMEKSGWRSPPDYNAMRKFQIELEKQKTTGDSP